MVATLSLCITYASLLSEPFNSAIAKPKPNSTPFTAGTSNNALAKSASNESNSGSPTPAGTFSAIHSTIPPMLSPSLFGHQLWLAPYVPHRLSLDTARPPYTCFADFLGAKLTVSS